MATILTYQADINGGHYALHTIGAGTIETIAMNAASYNNVEITPKRVYIGNYANPANITVTMQGGLQTIVPAYTNSYVSVQGYPVIDISNPGVESVQIMSVDEKMIPFAEDTFATLTVQGASSNNDILNHFNGTLSQNEGFLEGVTYTVGSDINFTANRKFGETAMNMKAGHGGLKITKTDYFDMSNDFCIDFWCYQPALPTASPDDLLFAITDSTPSATAAIMLSASSDRRLRLRVDINSATTPSSTAGTYDQQSAINVWAVTTWTHIALTKEGSTWRVFVDGAIVITLSKVASSVYDMLTIGAFPDAFTTAILTGQIDELRIRWGSALWTAAFTPESAAYD